MKTLITVCLTKTYITEIIPNAMGNQIIAIAVLSKSGWTLCASSEQYLQHRYLPKKLTWSILNIGYSSNIILGSKTHRHGLTHKWLPNAMRGLYPLILCRSEVTYQKKSLYLDTKVPPVTYTPEWPYPRA